MTQVACSRAVYLRAFYLRPSLCLQWPAELRPLGLEQRPAITKSRTRNTVACVLDQRQLTSGCLELV